MKKVYPYLFIFPAMAGIVAFVLYPMVKLITQSFYKVNPMNEANSRFIGLENYTKMFQTAAFKKALVNTGYYALFSVILIMVIALLLAVWPFLENRIGFTPLFREACFYLMSSPWY